MLAAVCGVIVCLSNIGPRDLFILISVRSVYVCGKREQDQDEIEDEDESVRYESL